MFGIMRKTAMCVYHNPDDDVTSLYIGDCEYVLRTNSA